MSEKTCKYAGTEGCVDRSEALREAYTKPKSVYYADLRAEPDVQALTERLRKIRGRA